MEGRVARSARSLSTAVRRYRQALSEAPEDAHGVRAELSVGLAAVLERQGRHGEKLELLHEATRSATRAGDVATLAHAHLVLGNTYGDLGTGQAERHLITALVLFEQLDETWGVASARNNLGVEAYYAGNWNLAIEHYGAALEAYRRIGDEANTAMALNNIGEIHSDQGEWDLATEEFTEARRMWRGSALGVAFVGSNLARLLCRSGDLPAAAAEFSLARDGLERVHAGGYLIELDARLAVFELASGHADVSLELASGLLAGSGELQPTVRCQLERTCALAAHALGLAAEARAHLATALDIAEQAGASFERAATLVAAGEIGSDDLQRRDADVLFAELGVQELARRAFEASPHLGE